MNTKALVRIVLAAVISLLAITPAIASVAVPDKPSFVDVLLDMPAITTDTALTVTAPEVGWSVDIDLAAAEALPVLSYDLYRSYHVPWPRSL